LQDLFYLCGAVLAYEPLPLLKTTIVDELDNDGFFVVACFQSLKPVRPKQRPKVVRQLSWLIVGSSFCSGKSGHFYHLQYSDSEFVGKMFPV
jgi:hypothetical protein